MQKSIFKVTQLCVRESMCVLRVYVFTCVYTSQVDKGCFPLYLMKDFLVKPEAVVSGRLPG